MSGYPYGSGMDDASTAAASGVGSWPGQDVGEAIRTVRDLLSDNGIPYQPELPARGPGADMVGRAAGLLVDMGVDLQPHGWRLVDRPSRDARRTAALWREDLDELAEAYDGYAGRLKVQLAGPWTLGSSVWLPRGERVVVDAGAAGDLAESLAEGLRVHLDALQGLVPGADLIVQVDEPALPAVLAGRLPTASGYGRVRAIEPQVAAEALRTVVAAAGERHTVVHCCDRDIPLPLIASTGVSAVSLDTALLHTAGWESVAATIEEGVALWAGLVPTDPVAAAPTSKLVEQLYAWWDRLGLTRESLADLVITPACGLSGLTEQEARSLQRQAIEVAGRLPG